MKKETMIWIIVCALVTCFVYIHRRVIRALIRWHVWCKDRRR